MKSMIRCKECGHKRKKGHENRVGSDRAYSEKCVKYEDLNPKPSKVKPSKEEIKLAEEIKKA